VAHSGTAHRRRAAARARHARQTAKERLRALTGFFTASGLLGLGFALVDQTQSGSNPLYYYGFAVAFLGIVALFNSAEDAIFRPVWLFSISFLVEIYGWWNVFWTIFDIPKCGGCNLGSNIILANLGGGVLVEVPLAVFAASSILAIALPIFVADRVPHDVRTARPRHRDDGELTKPEVEPRE
jgi:hypothetical protein